MKTLRFMLIFAGMGMLGFTPGVAAFAASASNADLQEKMTQQIVNRLKVFLPPDSKFDVSVQVQYQPPNAVVVGKKKVTTFDIGYMPVPVSEDFLQGLGQSNDERNHPVPDEVLVKSIDASIWISKSDDLSKQVQPDVEKKNIATITQMVRDLFSKIPTQVKVEYISKLPDPPSPVPAEKAFDLQKNIPYLVALLASIIIALGVATIGRSLRSASVSLTDGLLSLTSRVKTEDLTQPGKEEAPEKQKDKKEREKPAAIAGVAGSLGSIQAVPNPDPHSVKVIRTFIIENPVMVGRTLTDSVVDMIGLRHLLPYLEDKERSMLNVVLGHKRLQRMWDIALDDQLQAETVYDFNAWLHRISEKLTIRKLQGGSSLEQALGMDRMVKLTAVGNERLYEVTKKINQQAAWRVALEFLAKEYTLEVMKKMSAAELEQILGSAKATTAEISKAADAMITAIEGSNQGKAADAIQTVDERSQYYSKHLLDPVVAMINEKPLVEDELFLQRIDTLSAELGQLVRSRVWSPEKLKDIPEVYLERKIRVMSNEERTALILGLPKDHSERIRSMLPEGTGRSIVLDLVKQALAKPDADRDRKNLVFCRSFLESLKTDYDQKKFEFRTQTAPKAAA